MSCGGNLDGLSVLHIQQHIHSQQFCTTSGHFKIAHIQEHVLPLHDLTILNSAVSSVQHQITLR
jgi:hypothetical protein